MLQSPAYNAYTEVQELRAPESVDTFQEIVAAIVMDCNPTYKNAHIAHICICRYAVN